MPLRLAIAPRSVKGGFYCGIILTECDREMKQFGDRAGFATLEPRLKRRGASLAETALKTLASFWARAITGWINNCSRQRTKLADSAGATARRSGKTTHPNRGSDGLVSLQSGLGGRSTTRAVGGCVPNLAPRQSAIAAGQLRGEHAE